MSMISSMFGAYVDKFFKATVGAVTERFNDKKNEQTYLYESMLKEEYTADLTWNSTTLNHSLVAADVVSMDSSLPLKKRSALRTASGDIAKIGIKYMLKEKEISDITVMKAKGQTEAQIAAKILNNVPKVISGIKARIEIMFEQALSTGAVLVDSDTNDGTGIRATFAYEATHFFSVTDGRWTDATNAKPVDDIQQMVDKATEEGDTIEHFYISRSYLDNARKTAQVKELVATYLKQVIVNSAYLPTPPRQATLDAFAEDFGGEWHIVDGSYKVEAADGTQTAIKPWVQANVVGAPSNMVGRLVYGTLAEDLNRVAGVAYQKSGNYILVSQYSHNEPSLAEFTAGQALAFPVIDDGESMYVLTADKLGRVVLGTNPLEFTSAADATGKTCAVQADSAVTATVPGTASWCTATVDSTTNVVTITVSANTGTGATARTCDVTITDTDGNTATLTVNQAA